AFHRLARQAGVPIVHVQHWQRHGGIDDAYSKRLSGGANWRVLYELYLPPNPLMVEHSWEGTKWLDLMVEEVEGDYYIRTKKRLSAFYPTDFEFLLRQLDVENLVITGTYTDACVLSTAGSSTRRDIATPSCGNSPRRRPSSSRWSGSGSMPPCSRSRRRSSSTSSPRPTRSRSPNARTTRSPSSSPASLRSTASP